MKGPTSSEKRLKLFENRWLEKLTVISVGWFCAVWAILLPALAANAWGTTGPVAALLLVGAGWVIWSLFEYYAHRKLFHWEPRSDLMKQFVFVLHGNHHVQPTDELRNLMPPIVSIPVGFTVWAIMYALTGDWSYWLIFGFMSGYVGYDFTHYACHHLNMRGPIGQRLKRHHMRHHFMAERGNFAVTGLFWDRVFGTSARIPERGSRPADPAPEALEPAE